MMSLHLFSILMLSVSSNLDNFAVGIAYGIRRVCIPLSSNFLIAVINTGGTFISMIVGEKLYQFMQPATANLIGSSIFVIAGCLIIIKDTVKRRRKNFYIHEKSFFPKPVRVPDKSSIIDIYCQGRTNLKEGFLLAVALTFSNLATGIGAGLIGLNLTLTILFVFSFSIFTILIGQKIGQYSGARWLGGISDIVAGLLLILIGVNEIIF